MKHIFSSPVARFPNRWYHIVLLAAFLAVAAGVSVCYFPLTAHAATSGSAVPMSPTGFRPSASADLSQLVGKDPNVHVKKLSLPAASCAAIQKAQPGASCQVLYYWTWASHLPLPSGTRTATPSLSAGWWYWSGSDQECSIAGCVVWKLHETMDGVANGNSVWQWNNGCTPSGDVYSVNVNWCGYLYNGGGWPYYAMQFGLNGTICTVQIGPVGAGCFSHGFRQWVDDWGNFTSSNSW